MSILQLLSAIRVQVSGARGKSFADVARQTGAYGAAKTDSDSQVQQKFADYAITQNPGFQSTIPGPSNNTRLTLAQLKAAPVSDKTSLYDGKLWTWTLGDFSARASDPNVVKSDANPLTTGAWVTNDGALYAKNFGVKGDGSVETTAVQAFLDLCADRQRAAYFGNMAIVINGPLYARSVPVIFESLGNGIKSRPPAFYARGANYRALTMTGACTGSYVCVRADAPGATTFDSANVITSDTRPKIDGILCGSEDGSVPFLVSAVHSLYAQGLQGNGVELATCWDSTFTTITTEDCGAVGKPAFLGFANTNDNVNECHIARLQTERSVGEAIVIDPRCVSLTISKIHAEGTRAQAGAVAYVLGGVRCTYSSVRMQAIGAQPMCRVIGGGSTFTSLGAENIRVSVDASGSSATFVSPSADFESFPSQSGTVAIIGGAGNFYKLNGGWDFTNVEIGNVEIGFCAPGSFPVIRGGSVDNVYAAAGEGQAEVQLDGVRASGSLAGFRNWRLLGGTVLTGNQQLANQRGTIDATSQIVGDVAADTVALRLLGMITGKLTIAANQQRAIAGQDAIVTGAVSGWTAPTGTSVSGPFANMTFSKNLAATATGNALGWVYKASTGTWVAAGTLP